MIRHDVEDQSQPGRFQRGHHAVKTFPATNRRLNLVNVGHVIAVG